MALYSISYDLRKKRDYKTLYDELAKFNAVRILESHWCFLRFNTTAGNLRDHFAGFIDTDDGLFVCEVKDWGGRGTIGNPNQL
jgi:hypothetical protein